MTKLSKFRVDNIGCACYVAFGPWLSNFFHMLATLWSPLVQKRCLWKKNLVLKIDEEDEKFFWSGKHVVFWLYAMASQDLFIYCSFF